MKTNYIFLVLLGCLTLAWTQTDEEIFVEINCGKLSDELGNTISAQYLELLGVPFKRFLNASQYS
jgi:hypothetical protein